VPLTSGLRGARPDEVRQRLIETEEAEAEYAADLLERCEGKLDRLTAQMISQAAGEGNEMAREVLAHACQALGWAIAQVVTLVAPQVVVVGGGVASMDESLFLAPLRAEVNRYVFEPLLGTFQLVPATLGESVVVHGAIGAASGSGGEPASA
jgi:glucokinase